MPIIIDGWNLIRCPGSGIDDAGGDSLESAMELIRILGSFRLKHRDPITVVFDSSSEFLDTGYRSTSKLKVVPSRSADSYIKKYIEKTPERQRPNIRVVSSDNDIYYHAKSYRAIPLRSEEFWNKLET